MRAGIPGIQVPVRNGTSLSSGLACAGFLAADYAPRFPEAVRTLAEWVRQGQVRYAEDILDGIEKAPESVKRLYSGEHTGKLLMRPRAAGSSA